MSRATSVFVAVLLCSVSNLLNAGIIDTTSGWTGAGTFFGESEPSWQATLGQTFTVPLDDTKLDSFSFWLQDRFYTDHYFQAYVAPWVHSSESTAVAPMAYTGAVIHATTLPPFAPSSPEKYQQFTFNAGGIDLTAGGKYVAFLSASGLFDTVQDAVSMGVNTNNPYADGNAVFVGSDNSPTQFFINDDWTNLTGWDLAFRAEFSNSSVPEPSTFLLWSLLGGAGAAIGWRRRKRTA